MSENAGPIFLISGPPGAGKTSVGMALARRFERGMHLPVDDLREWVVSGVAHPVPELTDECIRQFGLARRAAGQIARIYADAGFAVTVADVLFPNVERSEFYPAFAGAEVHKILLLPPLAENLARNRQRTNKAFDTAVLDPAIHSL